MSVSWSGDLIPRHAESLSSPLPTSLSFLRHGRTNALRNIRLPGVSSASLQPFPHLIRALVLHEPCRTPKIIFPIRRQQGQHCLDIRPRLRQPSFQCRNTLRILQVERWHLHIACSLPRPAGEVVGIILEVTALQRHEGDYSGSLAIGGDAISFERSVNEGSGLRSGFAFGREGRAGAGARFWGHSYQRAGGALENERRCGRSGRC